LAKVVVQCSADAFVVNQRLVLRINICGENRHLRQARKRLTAIIERQLEKAYNQLKTRKIICIKKMNV
jgi:hypothetical protein